MPTPKPAPDWELVTREAGWQPRDSTGDFVYDNHMWILGGWFTPQLPNPLDVWKSPDGKNWTRVIETAPWVQSDLPVSLVHGGKMWMMGGRKLPGTLCSNKVWSSTDGAKWDLVTEHAGWTPRLAPGFVSFKGRIWVYGGTEDFYENNPKTLHHDVWSSADGATWKLETDNAGWSKRAHGQAVVFDNKLWMMGGGSWKPQMIPTNDVWCSADGVKWECVTPSAGWTPRIWFGAGVYRGRIWVMGGWSAAEGNFNDVWYSANGRDWTEYKSKVVWSKRHEPTSWVFQDKLWLGAGHAEPLTSEMWSLSIPPNWFDE